MNEHEIERIAAAANALRPDWPVSSLRTLLNRPELARRGRRDVAVALVWVACDPASTTPARVCESGPWWRAAGVEGDVTHTPPKRTDACPRCGRAMHSGPCDEDDPRPQEQLGGIWTPSKRATDEQKAAYLARCRADLAANRFRVESERSDA